MADLTVIILTKNEEENLPKALNSVKNIARDIIIVDSGSTDKTIEIAKKYGCRIFTHVWETHAKQFNWALENIDIKTEWIMRLDADEYLTFELSKEIEEKLDRLPKNINGVILKRRLHFMGKWIKHGGIYPLYLLRIFRKGKGKVEEKIMDEHIVLFEGDTITFKYDFIDENNKPLRWWIEKHNWYSDREMYEILNLEFLKGSGILIEPNIFGDYNSRKRWLKEKIYLKFPIGFRAWLYYIYRMYFRLGFLDGKEGRIFHFMQAYWYRYLVDAKIFEYRKKNYSLEEIKRNIFKSL